MTTYIVLAEREQGAVGSVGNAGVSGEGGYFYRLLGTYTASGPNQAIRALAGDTPGIYIAVPERNWTVVEAELEQPAPRMRLSEKEGVLPAPGEIPGQTTLHEDDAAGEAA